MSKPVVFFSHSTRDAEALRRLKTRFVELTGGTIDVFLSSDGQSIRLGRNWVSSVEEALKAAKLVFTFLTPQSLTSSWLYFESGVAYGQSIDVVPVGLFGVDVGSVPPPLSLLQGFNVTGHDSLNNLITKVNETFDHRHALGFLPEDYSGLQSAEPEGLGRMFGEHVRAIGAVAVRFDHGKDAALLEKMRAAIDNISEPKLRRGNTCSIPGAEFVVDEKRLLVRLDPVFAHDSLPIVENVLADFTPEPTPGSVRAYSLELTFHTGVKGEFESHRLLARFQGTGVAPIAPEDGHSWARFRMKNLEFSVWPGGRYGGGPSYIGVTTKTFGDHYHAFEWAEFLNMLFRTRVLSYEEDDAPTWVG